MNEDPSSAATLRWPHITALLTNAGHITIGYVPPVEGAAIAADSHNVLVALAQRPGESLVELMDRLEHATGRALIHGVHTNEIPDGHFILAGPKSRRWKDS